MDYAQGFTTNINTQRYFENKDEFDKSMNKWEKEYNKIKDTEVGETVGGFLVTKVKKGKEPKKIGYPVDWITDENPTKKILSKIKFTASEFKKHTQLEKTFIDGKTLERLLEQNACGGLVNDLTSLERNTAPENKVTEWFSFDILLLECVGIMVSKDDEFDYMKDELPQKILKSDADDKYMKLGREALREERKRQICYDPEIKKFVEEVNSDPDNRKEYNNLEEAFPLTAEAFRRTIVYLIHRSNYIGQINGKWWTDRQHSGPTNITDHLVGSKPVFGSRINLANPHKNNGRMQSRWDWYQRVIPRTIKSLGLEFKDKKFENEKGISMWSWEVKGNVKEFASRPNEVFSASASSVDMFQNPDQKSNSNQNSSLVSLEKVNMLMKEYGLDGIIDVKARESNCGELAWYCAEDKIIGITDLAKNCSEKEQLSYIAHEIAHVIWEYSTPAMKEKIKNVANQDDWENKWGDKISKSLDLSETTNNAENRFAEGLACAFESHILRKYDNNLITKIIDFFHHLSSVLTRKSDYAVFAEMKNETNLQSIKEAIKNDKNKNKSSAHDDYQM